MPEAYGSDFRFMPTGMCASQVSIVLPTMRCAMPSALRCAEIESPNGPAPMIRTFSSDIMLPPCMRGAASGRATRLVIF